MFKKYVVEKCVEMIKGEEDKYSRLFQAFRKYGSIEDVCRNVECGAFRDPVKENDCKLNNFKRFTTYNNRWHGIEPKCNECYYDVLCLRRELGNDSCIFGYGNIELKYLELRCDESDCRWAVHNKQCARKWMNNSYNDVRMYGEIRIIHCKLWNVMIGTYADVVKHDATIVFLIFLNMKIIMTRDIMNVKDVNVKCVNMTCRRYVENVLILILNYYYVKSAVRFESNLLCNRVVVPQLYM